MLPVDLSATGIYSIRAYTTLATDQNTANDTISSQMLENVNPFMLTNNTVYRNGIEFGSELDEINATWLLDSEISIQSFGANTGSRYMRLTPDDNGEVWAITSCFQLEAGKNYSVKFFYKPGSLLTPQDFTVAYGNMQSKGAMTNILWSETGLTNSEYKEVAISFSPSTTGSYYFGFNNATTFSGGFSDYIQLDDIEIKELLDNDVTVLGLQTPMLQTYNCYEANEEVKVIVKNLGGMDLANVPVEVEISGILNTTLTATIDLTSEQTDTVSLGTIDMTVIGEYVFSARTTLTTDELTSNDTLANISRVSGANTEPVTFVDFNGYTGTQSSIAENFEGWTEERVDPYYPTNGDATGSYWTFAERFDGNRNAVIDMFTDDFTSFGGFMFHKKDYIKSPIIKLGNNPVVTFKTAVTGTSNTDVTSMGSDDKLEIVVFSNCGADSTDCSGLWARNFK